MSEKKYIFTGEEKQQLIGLRLVTLHRIKAVKNFGTVMKGDLGGWVEKEDNLSHDCTAWIHDDAIACDSARVCANAQVYDTAIVQDAAKVLGDSKVLNSAVISGNARICGKAQISDNAKIANNAVIGGDSVICGVAVISADVIVDYSAEISTTEHVLVVGPIGRRHGYTVFYRNATNSISVKCGCFQGSLENFIEKVRETHKDNKYAKLYEAAAQLAQLQILGTTAQ